MKRADIPHLSVANTAVHKHGCHPPFKSLNAFTYVLNYTKKTPFFKIFRKIISAVIPDADVLNLGSLTVE